MALVGTAPFGKSPTSSHSSEVAKIAPAVLEADLPVRLAAKTFVSGIVFGAILKNVGRRIHQRSQLSPDTVSSGTCTSQASSECPPPLAEVSASVVKSRKQDAQPKTVVPMRRVSAATLKYTARRASQILSFANSEVAGSGADTDMAQSTTPSAAEEAKSRRRDSRTLNARKPGTLAVGSAKQAVASKHGRARLGADNLQDSQLMKSSSDELDSWSNASGSPTSAISQEAAPVPWWSTTAPSQGDVPLYHRQLEVTLSGAHLGTLLASPQSSAVFSGQPISLLADESAATLLAALAGQVASSTGPTLAEAEAAAAQDAAERAAAAAAAAAAEALAATAAGTTVAPAKKRLEEPDVYVVSAKAGAPGTVCADDLPSDDRRSVPSSADRSQSGSAAVGCSGASDLQLRSTVLMHELHDPSLRIHHLSNLDALHAPWQSLNRADPQGRRRTADTVQRSALAKKVHLPPSARPRTCEGPGWQDNLALRDQHIPGYDSLFDEGCPAACNPTRLRQIIQTRDLPAEYLHIVRSRFERRRSGQRRRRRHQSPRSTFQRFDRERPDLVKAWDTASSMPGSALITCSTEWCRSALHNECLLTGRAKGTALQQEATDVKRIRGEDLVTRWSSVCERIEHNWGETRIPANVRQVIKDGPMSEVTPGSIFELERHLEELLSFSASTRFIICDWIDREKTLEAIKRAHALCVNDARLDELKLNLQSFDDQSTELTRSIDQWTCNFSHFIVDVARIGGKTELSIDPLFIWSGKNAVDQIREEVAALARGEPHLAGSVGPADHHEIVKDLDSLPQLSQSTLTDMFRCGKAPPIVLEAMKAHKYSMHDALFDGSPPTWYQPRVARVGLAALQRRR